MEDAVPARDRRMRPGMTRVRLGLAGLLGAVVVATTAVAADAAPRRYESLEDLALRLVNCTRTGGWVMRDGTCRGFGSGEHAEYRRPLEFHQGIADEVAWPWARRIATARYCGHTLAGSSVRERFASAGYASPLTGENVGCSYAWPPRRMVIRTHRMMQSERSSRGWHWRQMRHRGFTSVGIGVVKVRDQTRIVIDFYGAPETVSPPQTVSPPLTVSP